MTQNGRTYFLDIRRGKASGLLSSSSPSSWYWQALLYGFADKSLKDYAAKVGDCFIQGAIISIMFAILKAVIDKASWRQVLWVIVL